MDIVKEDMKLVARDRWFAVGGNQVTGGGVVVVVVDFCWNYCDIWTFYYVS